MSSRSRCLPADVREDNAMAFFLQASRDLLCGARPPPAATPADDNHGLRADHPPEEVGEPPADAHPHGCGDAALGYQITVLFSDEGVLTRTAGRCQIRNHPRYQHDDAGRIEMR